MFNSNCSDSASSDGADDAEGFQGTTEAEGGSDRAAHCTSGANAAVGRGTAVGEVDLT